MLIYDSVQPAGVAHEQNVKMKGKEKTSIPGYTELFVFGEKLLQEYLSSIKRSQI